MFPVFCVWLVGPALRCVVFSLIVNLLMLTGPLFMLQIYDRVLTSGSIPTLVALAGLVVLLYALYGFLEFVRSRIMVRVAGSIDADVRDRAFDAVTFHAVKGEKSVRTMPLTDLAHVRQFLSGPGPSPSSIRPGRRSICCSSISCIRCSGLPR
jgi:ABC-type protease/lipase transport system fused ATPase/permease subunit